MLEFILVRVKIMLEFILVIAIGLSVYSICKQQEPERDHHDEVIEK